MWLCVRLACMGLLTVLCAAEQPLGDGRQQLRRQKCVESDAVDYWLVGVRASKVIRRVCGVTTATTTTQPFQVNPVVVFSPTMVYSKTM